MASKLKQNISALFILQIGNYFLPLLTIPYLINQLGIDNFGLIAFVNAVVSYCILIVDFGFNMSATKAISQNRNDNYYCSLIFSVVMVSKLVLLLMSYLILTLSITFVPSFSEKSFLLNIGFLQVIGALLFPIWMYQGREEMVWITVFNFSTRLIFTLFVFLFVHQPNDTWLVLFFTGLGSVVTGVCALIHTSLRYKLQYRLPSIQQVSSVLSESWRIFFSSLSINIYTNSIIVLLGVISSTSQVGYFSAAEKILQALKRLYDPFAQAVFPHVAGLIKDDINLFEKFVRRYAFFAVLYGSFASLIMWRFPENLASQLFDDNHLEILEILRYFAVIPLLVIVSNIVGTQVLLNLNRSQDILVITTLGASLGLLTQYFFISNLGASGAALSMLSVEAFVTVSLVFISRQRWLEYKLNLDKVR